MSEKIQAIDQFIKAMTAQGQQMVQEYNANTRQLWLDIAAAHPDIDFKSIDWAPSRDEPDTIIAIQQRFFAPQQP